MEELIIIAKELINELSEEEGSRTRIIFFEALENGVTNAHDGLNYGMAFINFLNCPMLILCRGGGGESFSWCIEEDGEIEWAINHFFEVNGLEFNKVLKEV